MGVSRSLKTNQPYNSIAFRVLLAIVWTHNTVMPLVRVVIERLPYIGFLAELLIPMSIILSAMACLPWFLRHIRGGDLAFYIGAVLIVLFSMVLHPITVEYLQEEWWRILVAAVPMYFIGVSFPLKECKNILFWCSLFSVLGMFIFRVYLLNSGRELENDDMDAAYRMLPSIMYLIYYANQKKKLLYVVIAGIMSCVIFIFGTRGPLICIVVYVALIVIHNIAKSRDLKKLFFVSIFFIALLAVFVFDFIFVEMSSVLAKIFGKIGFSTRIFDFILSGDITANKGRDYLARQAISAIIENPLWGYGITADRAMFGIYPHNIFLEILCQYGIVFGSILIVALLTITIMTLIKSRKNEEVFTFSLMFVSVIFVKLMISSTYTAEPLLFFMLGYFVSRLRKKK